MTPDPGPRWRCAAASLARSEPVAGTATHVRTWLLLEHVGPWGSTALLDARLPEGLGAELRRRAKEHRAKILLIRRFSSRPSSDEGLRVFAAYADPVAPRLESGLVEDARDVLDLDLGALRRGGTAGLPAYDGDLFCVCTNGRHDACCAEFGRPVAQALAAAHPEETWEVSHIGGDRFAGNMVILPHGLYYGRLEPESALAVATAHRSGRLDLDRLRGRSSYPMPAQAAEIALRRKLGLTALVDVRLTGLSVDGDVTRAAFDVGHSGYAVSVRTTLSSDTPDRLTCKAARPEAAPWHEVIGMVEH
ncbi:sucrase ferredoxin [Nocardioides sp. CER19]|uniref:sucrase ferredoxin n=1 Tax=Nocardioides sp. CER19 TaxID=3038538 RepID=UPI00244D0AD4|nr:sucrase ferredoxin [Nocardioides sp. CER19]MDH2415302.1 sucrase ferredoxin [Nocardioides sp. CER19]